MAKKRIRTPRPRYSNLREYRKAHQWSQRAAAAHYGISQSGWAKIELGKRRPRKTLMRLFISEGVRIEALVGMAS